MARSWLWVPLGILSVWSTSFVSACGGSEGRGLAVRARNTDGGVDDPDGESPASGGARPMGSGGSTGKGGAGTGGRATGGAPSSARCVNSLDCSGTLVCDPTRHVCVECAVDADCIGTTNVACRANRCTTTCASDRQCTPLGLLCDTAAGYCVQCVVSTDCPASEFCFEGACTRDLCTPGSSICRNSAVVRCSADGNAFLAPSPCGTRSTCAEGPAGASCEPWVCTAGQTECNGTVSVTCSADGLSVESSTNCADSSRNCLDGACVTTQCSPGARRCDGPVVRVCSADGLTETVATTCSTGQVCNPATTTCDALTCDPGQPACDGNVATTCNATGTGYTGARQDCSLTGTTCGAGICAASAVDSIPGASTGTLTLATRGNYYQVAVSRTLVQIEHYLNPSVPTTLVWSVYEGLAPTGTFNRIFTTTTSGAPGLGYKSSGPINVRLAAGRYYFIGTGWSSSSVHYYQPFLSQPVSFGTMFGGGSGTSSDLGPSFDSSTLTVTANQYTQRVTTTP